MSAPDLIDVMPVADRIVRVLHGVATVESIGVGQRGVSLHLKDETRWEQVASMFALRFTSHFPADERGDGFTTWTGVVDDVPVKLYAPADARELVSA